MATRPSDVPRWASDSGRVEPPEGKKDIGWEEGEKPPAGFFNWLGGLVGDWLAWLKAVTFDATGGRFGATGLHSIGAPGVSGVEGNGGEGKPGIEGYGGAALPAASTFDWRPAGVWGKGATGTKTPDIVSGSGPGVHGIGGDLGTADFVGPGVLGESEGTGSIGVAGYGQIGVFGEGNGTNSDGVVGKGKGSGAGVMGHAGSSAGVGVYGSGSQSSPGVRGVGGSSGIGVIGEGHGGEPGVKGIGVRGVIGESTNDTISVGGSTINGAGVFGSAHGDGAGVMGQADGTGAGVSAEATGNAVPLRINGTGSTRGDIHFIPRSQPSNGQRGQVYFDADSNKLRVHNGTSWVDLG